MIENKKQSWLLAILILLLIGLNYNFLNEKFSDFLTDSAKGKVERVIDGDTLVLEGGEHVRLLGINTPEKGEKYYQDAKGFLENKVLNKTVIVLSGREKKDLYGRTLGYILLHGENVNIKIVEEGFGNPYFPSGKDQYYSNFKKAWNKCVEGNVNLCEKSKEVCGSCIEVKNFDYKNQKVILYNKCSFSCEITKWSIKDEGRKKFIFPKFNLDSYGEVNVIVSNFSNNENNLFWKNEDYVWTDSGDTLFLRDSEGNLVLWENF